MSSAICFNLEQSKILLSVNGLSWKSLKFIVWERVKASAKSIDPGQCRPARQLSALFSFLHTLKNHTTACDSVGC